MTFVPLVRLQAALTAEENHVEDIDGVHINMPMLRKERRHMQDRLKVMWDAYKQPTHTQHITRCELGTDFTLRTQCSKCGPTSKCSGKPCGKAVPLQAAGELLVARIQSSQSVGGGGGGGGGGDTVRLQDGHPAACGVRVVAIATSRSGNYAVGQTGVISGIHANNTNPIVRWDHSNDQMQSDRHNLNVTNVVLRCGTHAAVGVSVVAIQSGRNGNFDQNDTGIISGIHENNTNPLVRWVHRNDQVESDRRNLINQTHNNGNMVHWFN
jgi:hypothetical protein